MSLQITEEFKTKVIAELLEARKNFDGTDEIFARQFNINPSVYNQLKKGRESEGLLSKSKYLEIARKLDVTLHERKWNVVKTDVYKIIAEDIDFCKTYSKAKICVSETGIGKTFVVKHLSRKNGGLKNCFYLDASQAKTKQQFVRLIAQTIGTDHLGKYIDVKATLKYYLRNMLTEPIIIIDEAGDLEYTAFLELKELWNATEGSCGWYMLGADGLRDKISKGIKNKKVGYRELFSRYSEKYTTIVPIDKAEKMQFYKKLLSDVIGANTTLPKENQNDIIKRCLIVDEHGNITGLRRAESLIIINSK